MKRKGPIAALLSASLAIGIFASLATAGGINTAIVSGPSGVIDTTSVTFEFDATGPATFQCRLDSSGPGDIPSEVAPTPWQSCASPHAYTDLAFGPHTFEVRARGAWGGVDSSPAKAAFFIVPSEPLPPETTIVTGPSGEIASSEAVFTFAAEGAEEFECRLDLGAWVPCTSPQVYEGLADGPHTFEVRAKDSLGTVDPTPAASSFAVEVPPPPAPRVVDPGPPDPVAGVSINAEPVDGKIVLICPGEDSSSRLDDFKQIPVGCLINARHGTINLTASKGSSGDTQAANFWGGVFIATQKAADNQPLRLKLAGRKMCERRKFEQGKRVQVRERRRRRSGRKLWGSGKGNYTTRGNYGSATVRGTIWLVRDRCDGSTLFKVKEGVVLVRDFVKGKSLTLETGESYIAKAKIPRLQFD